MDMTPSEVASNLSGNITKLAQCLASAFLTIEEMRSFIKFIVMTCLIGYLNVAI